MAAYTPQDIYDVATVRLNTPHVEAITAAHNAPEIAALMSRNNVSVESAIFSFLTEYSIRQVELQSKKRRAGSWRTLFR